MDRNLNLADYWAKSPPLLLGIVLMVVALLGVLFNGSEIAIGTSISSEGFTRDGKRTEFLIVELEEGSRTIVQLPSQESVQLGEKLELLKKENDAWGSSSKYKYEFKKYLE